VVVQPTSAAASGRRSAVANASRIPAASRVASTTRSGGERSLYLPAATLPPAPLKCTCSAVGTSWPRTNRAMPGKSGLGTGSR
jgi:hypothetical protein